MNIGGTPSRYGTPHKRQFNKVIELPTIVEKVLKKRKYSKSLLGCFMESYRFNQKSNCSQSFATCKVADFTQVLVHVMLKM